MILTRPPEQEGSLDRKGTFDEYKNPDIASRQEFRFPSSSAISPMVPGASMPRTQAGPASPGDAPFTRLQFPPRIEKLSGSVDFRRQEWQLALPAGAGNTVEGPFFRIPKDQVGWLQNNSVYILTPTALTLFSMAILINGGPVPGFDDIQIPPGVANLIILGDDDMRVRVPGGALISTLFTNISGVAATVGGSIQGWYHPAAMETRAWGEGEV